MYVRIYKRGRFYYVDYRYKGRRERWSLGVTDKRNAEILRVEIERRLIEGIDPMSGTSKNSVFVAMPMDPDLPMLDDVHDTIKKTANEYGLIAERVDDPKTSDKITDRIISSIKRATFVVVDLTYSKSNVYWEAGYAHGIGKTPIYIALKGHKPEFDVYDYPIIFFKNMRELTEGLGKRFKAVLEKD